jgi:hypothetical protein
MLEGAAKSFCIGPRFERGTNVSPVKFSNQDSRAGCLAEIPLREKRPPLLRCSRCNRVAAIPLFD